MGLPYLYRMIATNIESRIMLTTRALLFGVFLGGLDLWKLPYTFLSQWENFKLSGLTSLVLLAFYSLLVGEERGQTDLGPFLDALLLHSVLGPN